MFRSTKERQETEQVKAEGTGKCIIMQEEVIDELKCKKLTLVLVREGGARRKERKEGHKLCSPKIPGIDSTARLK